MATDRKISCCKLLITRFPADLARIIYELVDEYSEKLMVGDITFSPHKFLTYNFEYKDLMEKYVDLLEMFAVADEKTLVSFAHAGQYWALKRLAKDQPIPVKCAIMAAWRGDFYAVRILQTEYNCCLDKYKSFAIMCAIYYNDEYMCRWFIELPSLATYDSLFLYAIKTSATNNIIDMLYTRTSGDMTNIMQYPEHFEKVMFDQALGRAQTPCVCFQCMDLSVMEERIIDAEIAEEEAMRYERWCAMLDR
jgi:hypothetical protein